MTASHLLLRCTDYRLVRAAGNFMSELGVVDQYDDVAVVGSTKNIVDPYDPTDPEFVLRQVALSRKINSITTVVLMNHLACGAYGHGIFENAEEERQRHIRDLAHARRHVENRFQGMAVITILGQLQNGIVIFETV